MRAPVCPAGSAWPRSWPRARARAPRPATIARESDPALQAGRLTNRGSRVRHHGNSGAIKDLVAILCSRSHQAFKRAGRCLVRVRGPATPPKLPTLRAGELGSFCLGLRVRPTGLAPEDRTPAQWGLR